nr:MAG TPA: hypothetical protein [Caudoviricetes sp.]
MQAFRSFFHTPPILQNFAANRTKSYGRFNLTTEEGMGRHAFS